VTCDSKAAALPSWKNSAEERCGVLGVDWKDGHVTLEEKTRPAA